MSKLKKQISDKRKIEQIKRWNNSEISKEKSSLRSKKVHFDSTTRFLDACINFYKDEINELLNLGIDVNCADKDNLTAIHQACINSRIDLVEYLLIKNANINVCDKEGWTPLHIAADIGSYELAKFLIDHGARLDIANHDGDLPVMLVDEKEYPDLKIYIQKEMDKRNINVDESSNYERTVMLEDVKRWSLNNKYDPPIDHVYRSTPVHVAAAKNYVEVLYKLLPLLTVDDINAQDVDGWTALHAAAHWGHKEACTLLILNGADIDIRTRANETVLDTVDPILKTELIEEIKKAQIEKEKTKNLNLQNEIILRNDAANKRSGHVSRSSIARQSVECKKNAQMKESVSERQTLINARLNSESSGIITIDEADEKFSSPKDNSIEYHPEVDFNNLTEPFIDHKEKNIGKENLQIRPDKLYQNFNENPVADAKKTERNLLSNGDNFKNNASVQITENLDSNNALTINNLRDGDDQHLEECIAPNDDAVVLRPKSLRDEIISHRSTANSRLSLVMAPEKSEEAEVSRREKARRVRSTRRSTQAIDLGSIKEVEIRNSDIIKSQSINPENSSQTRLESINSGETNQYNIQADSHNDKDLKESTNFNYQNNKNETTDMNKSSSFCDRLNFDSVDSVEKKNLKHQNSCPSPRQDQIISRDVARLNITNKITALTRRKPGNLIKPIVSSVPIVSPLFVEKPTRGIDVNKCLESNNFSINRDANSRFPFKNSDNQSFLNSESIEEKNNGSFVAKPVSRNTLKAKTESDDIPNVPDTSKMIIYEHAEVSCSKDENPISKTILTRMINDQTTKQELAKENDSLKHKIKEYEDRIKQLEGDLLGTGKKNLGSESDKIAKLEIEKLKVREENQRLKSQNESLLRVISRIQQELENLR